MNVLKEVITILKRPQKIIRILGYKNVFNWLPDEPYLKLIYWSEMGSALHLDNPQTYNEKLQWIKLYDRRSEYSTYVDKYAVRSYIREAIGEEYLIPILGVYNSVEEIDWDKLPNQFVLKCTHGSSSNIICTSKSKLDIELSKKKLNKWMKKSWYWFGREWAYKDVKPRIICEKFLETKNNKPPADYKIMCFNGEPRLVQVHNDRFDSTYTTDFYDMNWRKTSITQGAPKSRGNIPKPQRFKEMVEISRKLSQKMLYARIDFYEHNSQLYFGEITLYPTSGFKPFENKEFDFELGEWIKLPN